MREAGKLLKPPAHLRVCAITASRENNAVTRSDKLAGTDDDPGHPPVIDREPPHVLVSEDQYRSRNRTGHLDGDELEKTVHRFNGVVEAGVDHDFHRGENRWRLASATTGRVETTVLERLNSRPSDCRPNS